MGIGLYGIVGGQNFNLLLPQYDDLFGREIAAIASERTARIFGTSTYSKPVREPRDGILWECDFMSTKITPKSFFYAFLSPASTNVNVLRKVTTCLKPGGVLIMVAQRAAINDRELKLLCEFQDNYYDQCYYIHSDWQHHVILAGRRREASIMIGPYSPSWTDIAGATKMNVPPEPPPAVFEKGGLTEREIVAGLEASPLQNILRSDSREIVVRCQAGIDQSYVEKLTETEPFKQAIDSTRKHILRGYMRREWMGGKSYNVYPVIRALYENGDIETCHRRV